MILRTCERRAASR